MKLKCLGSGSSGNCYLLSADNGETLILDVGIVLKEIKRGLDYDLRRILGVLVTHSHLDHAKSVSDFERMGIKMFTPYKISNHVSAECNYMGDFKIKDFALTDLDGNFMHTNADGSECPCYGFQITHKEMGKMLYITDTEFVKWRFRDVNHILISCNYIKDNLDDENIAKRNHVLRGHMELETVKEFIRANVSDSLQNVILCHLSAENADADKMVAEVQKIVPGAHVDVARAGKCWELRKGDECPF